MSYVTDKKQTNSLASLNRKNSQAKESKPVNKGLLDFILHASSIETSLVQRGRIHGA
ncbi:MAG: hypothetical protein ACRDD9_10700 [Shewanella sp.]